MRAKSVDKANSYKVVKMNEVQRMDSYVRIAEKIHLETFNKALERFRKPSYYQNQNGAIYEKKK